MRIVRSTARRVSGSIRIIRHFCRNNIHHRNVDAGIRWCFDIGFDVDLIRQYRAA